MDYGYGRSVAELQMRWAMVCDGHGRYLLGHGREAREEEEEVARGTWHVIDGVVVLAGGEDQLLAGKLKISFGGKSLVRPFPHPTPTTLSEVCYDGQTTNGNSNTNYLFLICLFFVCAPFTGVPCVQLHQPMRNANHIVLEY